MVRENRGDWQLYYIGRDYLGSITHVIREDGRLMQELSYDAWGNLRDPNTHALYMKDRQPVLFLGRGYTGHEHLTFCGLINMNARLYDPAVGRFLSPDPYVYISFFLNLF
jgi:RHS repeat-associated protein